LRVRQLIRKGDLEEAALPKARPQTDGSFQAAAHQALNKGGLVGGAALL
jgi:hypothetical protein